MATEEPSYDILETDGAFEIRRYAPMLVAETFVEGDMDEASNQGFRRIADFIFGNKQRPGLDQKSAIAMTAPVTVEPQSAEAHLGSAKRWRVHFVMPRQYTLENIPKPRNDAVRLREVPAQYFVVHRYSWLNTQARMAQKTQEALQWAKQRSLQVLGAPQLARYDPPWTPPMFKRNEIMLEVSKP